MEMTINQLMELTGKSFRTIKARIGHLKPVREDGRAAHYESKEALAVIYEDRASELAKESLLLERAKREKAEIEVGQLRGRLVPLEEVAKVLSQQFSVLRSQFRALPNKLAKPLSMVIDPHEVQSRLAEAVDECLSELTADARYQREHSIIVAAGSDVSGGTGEGPQAESEAVSSGVGGPVPLPESGVEQHSGKVANGKRRSRSRSNARRNRSQGEEDHRDGTDAASEDGVDK